MVALTTVGEKILQVCMYLCAWWDLNKEPIVNQSAKTELSNSPGAY